MTGRALPLGSEEVDSPATPLLPWLSWLALIAAGVLVFRPLTPTWNTLADYAFCWWVPPLSLLLLVERWPTRPACAGRRLPSIWLGGLAGAVLLFIFTRMAIETAPSWRSPLWVDVDLYVIALLSWLWVYGGPAWVRHFAFPVCFLVLTLPWHYRTEVFLVQNLAVSNTWITSHALVLLNIPAQAVGNIILLPNCQLGVEEACSGIRSLQAALMICFLLGELYRLVWKSRLLLVASGIGFALIGNFFRTLFLSILAYNGGPPLMDKWHDAAGQFILAFTALCSLLLCHFYFRNRVAAGSVPPKAATGTAAGGPRLASSSASRRALVVAVGVLLTTLAAEGVTTAWFTLRAGPVETYSTWNVQLPTTQTVRDLPVNDKTHLLLPFDQYKAGGWTDAQGWIWYLYWFHFTPASSGEEVFEIHNPDACLPMVGLSRAAEYETLSTKVNGVTIQTYPKKFVGGPVPLYVFWTVYATRSDFPIDRVCHESSNAQRVYYCLSDLASGRRRSSAETESLEISIRGPKTYEEAKAAYLALLPSLVVPGEIKPAAKDAPEIPR